MGGDKEKHSQQGQDCDADLYPALSLFSPLIPLSPTPAESS